MIIWFFSLLTMVIFKEDEPPIRSVTLLIKGLLHIARVMVSANVSSHDMLGVCGARCGLWFVVDQVGGTQVPGTSAVRCQDGDDRGSNVPIFIADPVT